MLICIECRRVQLKQSASFTLFFFATNVTLPLRGEYTCLPHRNFDGLGDDLTTAQYYYYPLKRSPAVTAYTEPAAPLKSLHITRCICVYRGILTAKRPTDYLLD